MDRNVFLGSISRGDRDTVLDAQTLQASNPGLWSGPNTGLAQPQPLHALSGGLSMTQPSGLGLDQLPLNFDPDLEAIFADLLPATSYEEAIAGFRRSTGASAYTDGDFAMLEAVREAPLWTAPDVPTLDNTGLDPDATTPSLSTTATDIGTNSGYVIPQFLAPFSSCRSHFPAGAGPSTRQIARTRSRRQDPLTRLELCRNCTAVRVVFDSI